MHWKYQIRLCESLVPTMSHFFENQKKMLLKNTVASVNPLRAIKGQADHHLTHSGQELNYDKCSNIILLESNNYDSQFSSSSSQSSIKVCKTKIGDAQLSHNSISEVTEENLDYEIGLPANNC